jgi:hypothetical protein
MRTFNIMLLQMTLHLATAIDIGQLLPGRNPSKLSLNPLTHAALHHLSSLPYPTQPGVQQLPLSLQASDAGHFRVLASAKDPLVRQHRLQAL